MSKSPDFWCAAETRCRYSQRADRACVTSTCAREIRVDRRNFFSIQYVRFFGAIIKPNHADVHICACENPVAIAFSKENVAHFLDAVQYFAIYAAANRLCRKQARALAMLLLDRIRRLREPVTAQVSRSRYSIALEPLKDSHVLASEFVPLAARPRNGGFLTITSASGQPRS